MNSNKIMKMEHIKIRPGKLKLVIAFLAITLAAISCSSPDEGEGQTQEPVTVVMQQATLNTLPASYRFSGQVVSDNTVQLGTKISGKVIQLDLEEGSYVEKGRILIRIKDDNLQAQKNQVEAGLAEAKASLANVEKNYERIRALFDRKSATQKELDDIITRYQMAKAKVQSLEASLNEIQDMLDYTVLKAPFNGYVVAKMISEGDFANPGQPLMSFEKEAEMKVEITVPETQISLFGLNDSVAVDIKAAGRINEAGIISSINPSGNPASRQFRVEVTFSQKQQVKGLKSGMFAEVGLQSSGEPRVTVPETAIIERGQLTGLYTLNSESEAVLRWVRLGDKMNGSVEVLSGLAPGEAYVATSDGSIREGQKVKVQ